ncbi:MAG: hypothetical protein WC059_00930 [Candidatus Paceibacterota bacterium]
MANAKLIINPAGLNARIVFANNEPPILFETQKQLFSALPDLVSEKKITQLEAVEIFKTAIYSKDFPVDLLDDDHEELLSMSQDILMGFLFNKIFGDTDFDESSDPIFKACGCGKHGLIVFGFSKADQIILSGVILSKQEGLMCVSLYEKEKGLNSKHVEKLRREILDSKLPDRV